MKALTDTELTFLRCLGNYGLGTCSELGESLWGSEFRKPQHYARAAGAVLRRLKRRGLVVKLPRDRAEDPRTYWGLTAAGRKAAWR